MSDTPKLSKLEGLKENSRQLRGDLAEELANDQPDFTADSIQLLKHHGSYQQDDRDLRKAKNPDGTPKGKAYSLMVRTRIPGGKVTAEQFLAELDLCDRLGNATMRITTRQGLQLHGVLKQNLKETVRAINEIKLTTFAACGDVARNVMCCPAPYCNNTVHSQMQEMAYKVAEHLRPRTTAYYEIWLKDENGEKTDVTDFTPVEEPIYGKTYLPRKFKVGFALPEDNCIELVANDLGFLAIVEADEIVGWNVLVGGGMGVTPSADKTFPALAKPLGFVSVDEVIPVTEAIVKVQRDFGNRSDRKVARMKYLIAEWGVEKFKAKVEEYYGQSIATSRPVEIHDAHDHVGWHEQGDGKWFLGVNIENGRIKDEGDRLIKTGLRTLLQKYPLDVHLTALQGLILCGIAAEDRDDIDRILREHGIKSADELSLTRRYSIGCPALPTCGLAVTESERVMPGLIDQLDQALDSLNLQNERIALHMTGCPNGCARPYASDIGVVGKSVGTYSIFLGGNVMGTRLNFLFQDLVPFEEVVPTLQPLLASFAADRQNGESFGDYCHRVGKDGLEKISDAS